MPSYLIHKLKPYAKRVVALILVMTVMIIAAPLSALAVVRFTYEDDPVTLPVYDDYDYSQTQPQVKGVSTGSVIRVGLYYSNNALPVANLANSVGDGFRIGYYDNNTFMEVARLSDVEGISMAKDKNLYTSGGEYFEENPGGSYA